MTDGAHPFSVVHRLGRISGIGAARPAGYPGRAGVVDGEPAEAPELDQDRPKEGCAQRGIGCRPWVTPATAGKFLALFPFAHNVVVSSRYYPLGPRRPAGSMRQQGLPVLWRSFTGGLGVPAAPPAWMGITGTNGKDQP